MHLSSIQMIAALRLVVLCSLTRRCIKVSLLSPQSPWILFFFSTEYLLEHYFQKPTEIRWYFWNLTTENLLFTVGKNNIFSSSIKHGKLRNRDIKLPVFKVGFCQSGMLFCSWFSPSSDLTRLASEELYPWDQRLAILVLKVKVYWMYFAFGFSLAEKSWLPVNYKVILILFYLQYLVFYFYKHI